MNKDLCAFIPYAVLHNKELSANAKLLYGEITALCNENGYCCAPRNYFAELLGVSTKSISTWISTLIKKGYLEHCSDNINEAEIETLLKNKNMSGLGIGNLTCEWCGVNTYILHEHHYPIPKCKGGTETVSICPNCHQEFHAMSDNRKYKIKDIGILIAKKEHKKNN